MLRRPRITHKQVAQIIALDAAGTSAEDIAAQMHIGLSSVYRKLRIEREITGKPATLNSRAEISPSLGCPVSTPQGQQKSVSASHKNLIDLAAEQGRFRPGHPSLPTRSCMGCRKRFHSEGRHNHFCNACRQSNSLIYDPGIAQVLT